MFVHHTDQDANTVLGMELSWFVLVAVSSVLVVSACIVSIAICVCRRSTRAQGIAMQSEWKSNMARIRQNKNRVR